MPTTVSFLFWNIRKALGTRFYESLGRLARQDIDVFLFAEPPPVDDRLLTAMNGEGHRHFSRIVGGNRRLMLFARVPNSTWSNRYTDRTSNRITAHELTIDGHLSILLIGAHLHSPNNLSLADRAEWVRQLMPEIREVESDVGHSRTVLVGDLNMNPFDAGLIETSAFHALMSRALVDTVRRMKSRRSYLPFYNPMWSLLGDQRIGLFDQQSRPAGTFFHENYQALSGHFWQMFDQVLLRPELMDSLTRLEILESDGRSRLISRSGRPRRSAISDHLPLRFDLVLSQGSTDGGNHPRPLG